MKKLFVLSFLLASISCYAQEVLENNPFSLKWYQVNTPHFRVLFPKGFDAQAQRMANTLEHIHDEESATMGKAPRKISVVLQNQSSVSNGFVSILPRRSEFYTMPSQDYNFTGTNDWLNLLASHEFRHVVQYQHANRGFNRLLYYAFGFPTLAGMAHAAAPDWFWEGDAVATETAFTPSGRGRIPRFGLVFRTNLLEGRTFNYHKQYLRSYKNNIPNHYVLGFYMVSYLRKRTNDPDIWEKIMARSWSVPFIPFAFSNAIKNKTGMHVTKLYREMAADLKKQWRTEIDTLTLTSFEKVNTRKNKAYTDYLYPQPLEDGSVLVLKRGIGDIETFVTIKDGQEKKIFTPGFINDAGLLSVSNNVIVWNEYGFDPRWRVKNYSLIKAYDINAKERIVITNKHSRYGSAGLSPSKDKIVTVQSNNNYEHRLTVLNYPSGVVEKIYPNPDNNFLSMPRWSADGKKIVVLKTTTSGKTISIADAATETMEDIFTPSQENYGSPVLIDHYVFYNSPISGIDNIYAVDLNTKQRFQITNSKYGAYNFSLSADQKTIYYNEQTRDGLDVVKIPFDPTSWKRYNARQQPDDIYQHLVEQEGHPDLLKTVPQTPLKVTRYSKWKGMLNPYGWGTYFNGDLSRINVGITSQDILSTTNISAGYVFDLNERTGFWNAGVSYQGFYPIIDVNFTQGNRSVNEGYISTTIIQGKDTTSVTNDIDFKWTEQNLEAGLRIPLITTTSRYAGSVTIGNALGLTKVSDFESNFTYKGQTLNERYIPAIIRNDSVKSYYPFYDYIGNGTLVYNHFKLSASRFLKTSRRDIYSKWGQSASLNYYNTPSGDVQGGLLAFITQLYFPGLAKHHSLHGYWAYQSTIVDYQNSGDGYLFRTMVPKPRGIDVNRFKEFYSMSANYTFPVWYPDIALGPILNIQRLRATAFADYAAGAKRLYDEASVEYLSVGGELKFDINILRFLPQLDIGLRYSYGIRPSVTKFEVLIGTFNF